MSDPKPPLEDLGSDFEIIPDHPEDSAPKEALPEAPAPSRATPEGARGPSPRVGSVDSWASFGLVIALAGLLSSWGEAEAKLALLRGLLAAGCLHHLLAAGLGAVQPTGRSLKPILPGLLVLGGIAALVVGGGFAAGPAFALLGGLLALAATSLGGKKDAAAGPPPQARPLDAQFSASFGAYLMAVVGILMPWCGSGQTGVDALFGVVTLVFLLITMWASWVGSFRLWTMPVVTGKLGTLLFVAPMEVSLLGAIGVMRHLLAEDSLHFAYDAWPAAADGAEESFLQFGAGPLLTLVGGMLALVILVRGATAASAMAKERKAAEIEARKAARAARKGK